MRTCRSCASSKSFRPPGVLHAADVIADVGRGRDRAVDAAQGVGGSREVRLVSMLLSSENGEICTCDVTEPLGLSQPTISHHFKKLTEAGLVTGERRGTWT